MCVDLQRMRIITHLRDVYDAEPEHLWSKYPNYMVFRHLASKKWFAAIFDVPKDKLGLLGQERVDILNVKCGPLLLGTLLSEPGFLPAYHMNKETWVSILLDGSVPDDTIFPLLALSYDAAVPKRGRKPIDGQQETRKNDG